MRRRDFVDSGNAAEYSARGASARQNRGSRRRNREWRSGFDVGVAREYQPLAPRREIRAPQLIREFSYLNKGDAETQKISSKDKRLSLFVFLLYLCVSSVQLK